mgnify:FL=1
MKINFLTKKGFTLIELLLYVSLSSVLLISTSFFMSTLLEARIKNQTIAEVEQQGLQIMQVITQTIRNAESINTPTQGIIANTLSVNTYDININPTVFEVVGNVLRIKEGSNPAIDLLNSKVKITDMNFSNLMRPGTPGSIRVEFVLSYVNNIGRNEFNYSKKFTNTATLRQP